MKKLLLLPALLVLFNSVFAKPVDEKTAKFAGYHFLTEKMNVEALRNADDLQLVYTAHSSDASQVNYYYVFNVQSSAFVMVSADDNAIPVFGYSTEGNFDPNNIPDNAIGWFKNYENQIKYIIENDIPATEDIFSSWKYLLSEPDRSVGGKTTATYLLTTKWGQDPYYNDACPFDVSENKLTVAGCVATAMAQAMKYWNYPATGTGSHSYNHSDFGTLSANFGATTYQWNNMPNSVGSSNTAVATLMYHAGVSVNMNYRTAVSGGSGAYVIEAMSPFTNCAEYALKNYFGYTQATGISRGGNTQSWINTLKTEIDNLRPIIYAGFGSAGGHAWIADGYDNNDFFHINWGWSGSSNGYFTVDAMNPPALGTGGGSGGFNYDQHAIIGIQPPPSSLSPDQYEMNNNNDNAHHFPVNFSGNTTQILTTSSTVHTTNDADYYSIMLPVGDNYIISARLHDASNSGNGHTYTLDAKFAASVTGVYWGTENDDIMPGTINYNGGGMYYFKVTPKIVGSMGSYLLEINITRQPTGVADMNNSQEAIKLYPNPASDFVQIELTGNKGATVTIADMQGRVVKRSEANTSSVNIPVSDLANGLYLIRIQTAEGNIARKISIER